MLITVATQEIAKQIEPSSPLDLTHGFKTQQCPKQSQEGAVGIAPISHILKTAVHGNVPHLSQRRVQRVLKQLS